MTQLSIAETFLSIQGESTRAGLLCFFIRFAGCNLKCVYCDTGYAADAGAGTKIEIDKLVTATVDSGVKLVEITGGEPMVQPGVVELCQKLQFAGMTVLVETNGSLPVWTLPAGVIRIIDCKTPSSGEHEKNLYRNYDYLSKDDEIKFVLSDFTDYCFAKSIIEQYQLVARTTKLLFSPVPGKLEPRQLAEWMIADKVPARMQLQMHKIIWGADKRGV